jgi:hypothetical protein
MMVLYVIGWATDRKGYTQQERDGQRQDIPELDVGIVHLN